MLELLRERHSVRRFEDREIDPETVAKLKEAVLRAPSSRNIRPWRFVFVTERTLLERLSHAKPNHSSFIADARLAIVICAQESASDVWIEDCAIAGIIAQLTATSLGLGSCWVQIRERTDAEGRSSEAVVRDTLGLDEGMRIETVLAVGYSAQDKPTVAAEALPWDHVIERP